MFAFLQKVLIVGALSRFVISALSTNQCAEFGQVYICPGTLHG